jgi:hypothetical protein
VSFVIEVTIGFYRVVRYALGFFGGSTNPPMHSVKYSSEYCEPVLLHAAYREISDPYIKFNGSGVDLPRPETEGIIK